MTSETLSVPSEESSQDESSLAVIDLRQKQKRKAIKQLRKGRGKLSYRIQEMVADMRKSGEPRDGNPLVIVVREKRKKRRSLSRLLRGW